MHWHVMATKAPGWTPFRQRYDDQQRALQSFGYVCRPLLTTGWKGEAYLNGEGYCQVVWSNPTWSWPRMTILAPCEEPCRFYDQPATQLALRLALEEHREEIHDDAV